jgi:hypothetical protein
MGCSWHCVGISWNIANPRGWLRVAKGIDLATSTSTSVIPSTIPPEVYPYPWWSLDVFPIQHNLKTPKTARTLFWPHFRSTFQRTLPSNTDAGIWHTSEEILHEAPFVFSNLSDSLFFCNLKKLDFDLLTTDILPKPMVKHLPLWCRSWVEGEMELDLRLLPTWSTLTLWHPWWPASTVGHTLGINGKLKWMLTPGWVPGKRHSWGAWNLFSVLPSSRTV